METSTDDLKEVLFKINASNHRTNGRKLFSLDKNHCSYYGIWVCGSKVLIIY